MNIQGLNDSQVADSRQKHGSNILTPPKKQSLWRLYLEKYRDPIIEILLVAALISLVLAIIEHQYVETIGIFIAIFLATTVGFFFEMDAARKFDVLTQLNEDQRVKVIRNGQVQLVMRRDIVVGDVVIVETGDEIPADGTLIECNSLQVDESMLTGEPLTTKSATVQSQTSMPQQQEQQASAASTSQQAAKDSAGNDSTFPPSMLLRSSMVMNGRGVFSVTTVGDATEIGKVARTSSEKTDVKTPLNMQLDRLGKFISKFGFGLSIAAAVLFLGHDIIVNPLWHSIGQPDADYVDMAAHLLRYFMLAVSLIVMAVPEGLPMAVTLSLALNMRRMLKSNNLVRKLHACETMGAVTVICTDKTGTLTQNKMQVAEVCTQFASANATAEDDIATVNNSTAMANCSTPNANGATIAADRLAEAIAVNTTAHLDGEKGIGNPTEAALLLWLRNNGCDYRRLRKQATVTEQVPFSTETKQMTTTVRHADGTHYLYKKGAPEIVMAQCRLTDDERQTAEALLLRYQQKAMRTLALAVATPADATPTLQAIFGITDPIRPDVAGAVRQCNDAGIEVKIVTGDVDATAMEIARQISVVPMVATQQQPNNSRRSNLRECNHPSPITLPQSPATPTPNTHHPISISGTEFSALPEPDAMAAAKSLHVMYRARPQDKQRLVRMLQQAGAVVAVTGDGTNDAPALNYAHVGLSLGSGTNVAKEASDMTLLDDSFSSIAKAVMWGRSLYRNIQRFLFFQLVVNVVALLLVIAGSLIGTEMPLTITQILWVNLIMDTFAALALASLPPSREVMKEMPRKQTDFILTPTIIRGILTTGIMMFCAMFFYLVYCEYGIDFGNHDNNAAGIDLKELTRFFTVFIMLQWWNLFNAKAVGSRHSAFRRLWAAKGFLLVLVMIIVGQVLIVQFGGEMFRCTPLPLIDWVVIFIATMPVMIAGEIYRHFKK